MKENSINNWVEMTIKHTNNRMQEKPNNFGLKYGNQKKNIRKRLNMTWELELEEGPKAEIHIDLLKMTLKNIKMENVRPWWNTWFLVQETSIHDKLALEMNKGLRRAHVPELMTKGMPTLIQKDPSKGTAPNNYWPITCLPMMWKILTAQIREEIYYSLTSHSLFPDEQKDLNDFNDKN